MEERIRFVVMATQHSQPFSALCEQFGISRQTGYKWLGRYRQAQSLADLEALSRRPHHSPMRTSPDVEAQVVALRARFGWGARKLQVLLKDQGTVLGVATINRILERNDLIAPPDRHRPATKRFCRAEPNELWQMDFKGDFPIREGRCHPLSIIDDHSRFLLALHPLLGTGASAVHEHLLATFGLYGLPGAILVDHGTPWWSNTNALGLTWLAVAMIKQDIRLLFSGVGHPQTQGKVERLHGSLARAMRHQGTPDDLDSAQRFLSAFRCDYNLVRPHERLDMEVPAKHYLPSLRAYNPTPGPWHYPHDVAVRQLNSQGMLPYAGTRYFVCEALAGESVGVQAFDGKLLVSFRQMLIRQIDLRTNQTLPLVRPLHHDVSTMS